MLKYVRCHCRGERNKLIFVSAVATTRGNGLKFKSGSFSCLLKENQLSIWQEQLEYGGRILVLGSRCILMVPDSLVLHNSMIIGQLKLLLLSLKMDPIVIDFLLIMLRMIYGHQNQSNLLTCIRLGRHSEIVAVSEMAGNAHLKPR